MLEIEIEIEYRSDYGKGPTDPESRPASSEKKMLSSWCASRRRNKKNNSSRKVRARVVANQEKLVCRPDLTNTGTRIP
jgi:hypothetical protein